MDASELSGNTAGIVSDILPKICSLIIFPEITLKKQEKFLNEGFFKEILLGLSEKIS